MKTSLTNQTILSLYGKSLDRLQLEMDKNKVLADKLYEQRVAINYYEKTKKQYIKLVLDSTNQITELQNQLTDEQLDHHDTKVELNKKSQELEYALNAYTTHINITI
jgi:hypothetical protein